jgi:hypothetical protein
MDILKVTLQKEHIYSVLKLIKAGLGKGKRSKVTTCELTFTDNKIEIAIPGRQFTVKSVGIGAAKATLPFFYLYDIIEKSNKPILEISLGRNQMTINSLTIGVATTFFEDDRVLRTIDIPLNYNDKDLLLLKKGRYTKEELAFNKLIPGIEEAENNLAQNIEKAYQILKPYGVKKTNLKSLINLSLNLENR